jgi:carboxylesterase type B
VSRWSSGPRWTRAGPSRPGNIGWTREQYETWVRQALAESADAVLTRYPWPTCADELTGAHLSGAIETDAGLGFGIGGRPNRALTRDLATHVPTWAHEFAARTGPGLQPIPGYERGAGHAPELAYLFPSLTTGSPSPRRSTPGSSNWRPR